jgi:hypothetical protein
MTVPQAKVLEAHVYLDSEAATRIGPHDLFAAVGAFLRERGIGSAACFYEAYDRKALPASRLTKEEHVQALHPDWSVEQIKAEVAAMAGRST